MLNEEQLREIVLDKRIRANSRLLYIYINLEATEGFFGLNNTTLAKALKFSRISVSQFTKELQEAGYIDIYYDLLIGSKAIENRIIVPKSSSLTIDYLKARPEYDNVITISEYKELTSTPKEEKYIDDDGAQGFIYIIKSEYGYKIGLSKNIKDRLKLFGVKLPFPIEVVGYHKVGNMHKMELHIHKLYKSKRLNGEWFTLDEKDLVDISTILVKNEIL
jgi:hypothetical protein